MQKKKSFSWKQALTAKEREEALAKIGRWVSFSPFTSSMAIGEKKISRVISIDPKLIQVLDFLIVRDQFVDTHPQTYHAILSLAESVCLGSYGRVLEEFTREEQEIAYSGRILFALLCHYQAHHGTLESEFFFPISSHPRTSEWLAHTQKFSSQEFGNFLIEKNLTLSEKDRSWKEEALMFFHMTEIRRFPWNQITHLYRQTVDYFHYQSSATIKLILSDPKQFEVWKKAAEYALKLPPSLDQQQAWLEIATHLEFRAEGRALLDLLAIAPTHAQETLIRHWLDLKLKQEEQPIAKKEWERVTPVLAALNKEKSERLVRIAVITCARKREYDKAIELLNFVSEEEKNLLFLAILEICVKQGDFEKAEAFLTLLSEQEFRQEAIQKLLEAMIRADRSLEADAFVKRLPRQQEQLTASRAISASRRRWAKQRRIMRSSLLARHIV